MGQSTKYKYTAIKAPRTIRLIEVQPGGEIDPIRLSISSTPLDDAPDFEAISYCWGDGKDRRQVICDGVTLSITSSLFTGLLHFRYPDRPRLLWADAVCIDQENAIEKGSQVLLMPFIYSEAVRVLVWLGIANDPVYGFVPPDVVDTIHQGLQLVPDYDPAEDEFALTVQNVVSDLQRLRKEGMPNALDYDWAPFSQLLARPWFRRKWVVQEVALGKEVLIYVGGGIELRWPELLDLSVRMLVFGIEDLARGAQKENTFNQTEQGKPLKAGATSNEEIRPNISQSLLRSFQEPLVCIVSIDELQDIEENGTLLGAILATSGFACMDQRDHVYSLLNLVDDAKIQPDYEVSVGEVFRRFAIMTLFEEQDLKLLSLAPHRYHFPDPDAPRLEGLPSWVPDLRVIELDVLPSDMDQEAAFSAGGKADPVLSLSEDRRVLSCQGRLVDTARAISTPIVQMVLDDMPELKGSTSEFQDPVMWRRQKRNARWMAECYRLAFGHDYDSKETYCSDEDLMRAFSRTMLCDTDRTGARAHQEMIAAFPQYMQTIHDAANSENMALLHFDSIFRHAIMISDTMDSRCSALTLCVTDSGRFGNIPAASLPGDIICVLTGGAVPFVIRPTGTGTYTLIGECYLDGIMDGEEVEGFDSGVFETIHLE